MRTAAVSTTARGRGRQRSRPWCAGEDGSCSDAGGRVRTAAVSTAARGRGRQRSRRRRAGEDGSGLDAGARVRTAAVSMVARGRGRPMSRRRRAARMAAVLAVSKRAGQDGSSLEVPSSHPFLQFSCRVQTAAAAADQASSTKNMISDGGNNMSVFEHKNMSFCCWFLSSTSPSG